MLKVTMVGTGSAFSKKHFNNSGIIEFENGYRLLIDCGHSVPMGLHKQGLDLSNLDGILITHLHNDHVGGLEEVALSSVFIFGGRKLDLFVPEAISQELWWNCLKAGLEPGGYTLEDYFNVIPLVEDEPVYISDVPVNIYRTNHVKGMDSFAVGFEDSLFFSSDTVFDKDLIDIANKYSTIFHDCQLAGKGEVHATLEELLTLPWQTQAKMFLMHYGDDVMDYIGSTGDMIFAWQGVEYVVYSRKEVR